MVRVCQTLQMCVGEWDLAGGCCLCVAQLPFHRPVFISMIFKEPEPSRIAFRNCLYCAFLKGNQDSRFTLCSPLHSKVKQENWTVKPFVHSAAIHTNKARPTVLGCKSCWFLSRVKTRSASRDRVSSCCRCLCRQHMSCRPFPSRSSHGACHLHTPQAGSEPHDSESVSPLQVRKQRWKSMLAPNEKDSCTESSILTVLGYVGDVRMGSKNESHFC